MSTSTGRNLAFALGLSAVVAMSGFLLNAAPPQAVGTWEVLGTTDPSSARSGAATATLEDDTTLIAGGRMLDGTVTDSVLIYDPTTNASTVVGHLASPRVNAAAARLDDGRVLIVGGEIADLLSADAEIFDPFTGTSDVVANMAVPRTRHAATRLADGKVLIVGGVTLEGVTLATAEVFDPETGSILEAGSMATPRAGASATLLIDNRVLVAGGNDGAQDLASAELFYPATQEFFPVDTALSQARAGHTAVLLPHNGAVLIAGGTVADAPVANAPVVTTDLFLPTMFPDPYTWSMGTFGPAEHLTHARTQAVSGPMGDDGYAFVAGGGVPEGEAYAFATLKTDKDDYAPGEFALITGSGWQPGEVVKLVFQEDPAVHEDYVIDGAIVADAEGNFAYNQWAPEGHDANVRFYLTATGTGSQRRAQITFTDSVSAVTIVSPTGFPSGGYAVASGGTLSVPYAFTYTTAASTTSITYHVYLRNIGGSSTDYEIASNTVTGLTNGLHSVGSAGSPLTVSVPFDGSNLPTTVRNYNLKVTVDKNDGGGSSSNSETTNGPQSPYVVVQAAAATTTTVASSSNPSTYGNSVTFTATVTSTSTPTGGMNFVIGGGAPVAGTAGSTTATTATWTYTTSSLNAGTHSVTANYVPTGSFESSSGSLTGGQVVNQRPATWVTNPASKTYGDMDPDPLTTGSGDFLVADNVTATYSRAMGETVLGGPYHITAALAPAGVLSNYTVTNNGADFTISPRPATWTTDAASKVYGNLDPNPLTTGSGDFLVADNVTATYSRAMGETVLGGPYHITAALAPAGVLSNYTVTNNGADFTISPRPATWTTDAASKVYGNLDPNPLTTGSGDFLVADNVTATYSRAMGETVLGGPYHITAALAPAGVLSNYTVTNNGADFTISPRPATWTTDAASKVYGNLDPNPLTTGSGDFLVADNVTATYSRAMGETVLGGPYHITAALAPAGVLSNYTVTNNGADFTISPRPATWTTDAASKVYGNLDPNPLTTGSGDFLVADNVTATYSRAMGETVLGGPYHITAALAPAGVLSNYTVTNNGADFTISPRPATWTTDAASKVYGNLDPNPLTTGSGDFLVADNVTATYSRAMGETVLGGPYHITAALAPAGVLSNYTVTNNGADFTISPRPATWTTDAASKVYGNLDPNPLTTGSGDFLVADNVTATYSRAMGETVLGGPYHITAALAPAGVLSNYTVTNNGADFTISPRPATWTTDAASKVYGNLDPNPLTTGSGDFLVADNVTATYSRAMGETVLGGPYHITAALAPAGVLSNYTVTNNGADFTISPRPATWTTDAASKVYGNLDPNPLTTGSGDFLVADNVTATYSRAMGETVLGGPYHITAALAPAGVLSNYTVTNNGADFTISPRPATWTTNSASKILGAADPNPLTTGSGTFVPADNVTATYARATGETVGTYAIAATLSPTSVLSNYTITNDGTMFSIVYASTGMCLGSPGHQILQPLNFDNTSVVKKGSTVPVKFRVCDANGNSIGTPGVVSDFRLVEITNGVVPASLEEPASTTPDTVFRWSATDQQWIFNLSTKNLSAGKTYGYLITLNDGTTIAFKFGTKQ